MFSHWCMHNIDHHNVLLYKDHLMQAISYHCKMQRATNPCRQLNSEGVKAAALCYLSPIIHGKCSIISARCIASVKQQGLEKAWKDVCRMRDNCDKAVSGKKWFSLLFPYWKTYYCIKRNISLLQSCKHIEFLNAPIKKLYYVIKLNFCLVFLCLFRNKECGILF